MDRTAAFRIMQACVKLSNVAEPQHLVEAAKNKTKLFELMIFDGEELDELSKGGTVAGIKLSDVENMTHKQLREKLKKTENERDAARRVSDQKDDKINELSEENASLEMKNTREAKKLELDTDPKIEITKSCLLSIVDVTSDMQARTTELIQVLNCANDADLSRDFFKQMALAISQVYHGLGDLLDVLPDDVEPVDTSWYPSETK